MTLTWSDLAEAPTSLPAEAVTDLSQVEVVGYHRHVLSPPDASGTALVRDALTERFAGGLDGEGHAEHLRVVAADGSNTFVGAERFDGRLTGRCGSFALTAHGTTTADGLVRGAWRVVAGSATGELRGLRGRGAFTARQHADGVWRSEDRFTHWYEPEEAATVATTAPAARPQGRHDRGAHGELVDAGRARLYVERRGSGPAVLFIPGGGVDASHFAAVAELLADAFTTVTYDRRGYFRSPPPPGWQPASLDEQADDAAGLLQRLGLGPAAVWGGSLGGIILLGLLRRHPGLVAAALVHEPPLFTLLDDRDQHLQRLADMGAQARRLGVRPVMAQHARAELGEAFDRLAAGARTRMLANAEAFLRIDVPGLARSMPSPDALTSHVPTAVLASPESRNTPLGQIAVQLAQRLQAPLTELPGGHVPYLTAPDTTAATIRAFLQQQLGSQPDRGTPQDACSASFNGLQLTRDQGGRP